MGVRGRKNRRTGEEEQLRMADVLDEIREFEEWRTEIYPKIAQMVKDGKAADEILAFAESLAAAKLVSVLVRETDSSKVIAASKDILDRCLGKAKERSEVTHKYEKLKDEELDALIQSRLTEIDEDEHTEH